MIKTMTTQPHPRNNESSILGNITIVNDSWLETPETGAHGIGNQSPMLIYEHQFCKMDNRLTAVKSSPTHGSRDSISAAARGARA
jgi:hypothetical protein